MDNTTIPAVTPASVGIRYGLITGIISVIYSFVLMATGLDQKSWLAVISFGILIVGIVLAHKFYKQQNGNFMSYGQGLGIGAIEGAVIGLLSGIFRYIYVNFIDNSYTQRLLDAARVKMEADGKLSAEQVDQAMGWTAKLMPTGPIAVVWAVIATTFFAFVLALIISAFTKNARPEFE